MKNAEKALLIITVIAVVFTVGFAVGRSTSKAVINITESAKDSAPLSALQPDISAVGDEQAQLININTADIDTLSTLPGIGQVIAQRIIDYRNENGAFQRIADIMSVRGIGDGIYENISELITVA